MGRQAITIKRPDTNNVTALLLRYTQGDNMNIDTFLRRAYLRNIRLIHQSSNDWINAKNCIRQRHVTPWDAQGDTLFIK